MAGKGSQKKPISLFYSYSHKDEDLRLKLQDHLAALRWSGMIAEWHDRDIEVGKEWEKEIDHHLSRRRVVLSPRLGVRSAGKCCVKRETC